MKRIKELQAKLKAALKKLQMAKGMFADAKDDEAAIALAQKAYDLAKSEHAAVAQELETAVEEAEQDAETKALEGRIGNLTKAIVPEGASFGEGEGEEEPQPKGKIKIKAQAVDHKDVGESMIGITCKFLKGEELSDNERDAVMPKGSKQRQQAEERGGIAIPQVMFKGMFPEIATKASPMLSTDNDAAGGRVNLLYPERGTTIGMLSPDDPSLFKRVNVQPVTGGYYEEPILAQEDTNELGGATVDWPGDEDADAAETDVDLDMFKVQCYPVKAFTEMSSALIRRDRYNFVPTVMRVMREACVLSFDNKIMNGAGDTSSEPLGIRNAAGTRTVNRAVADKVSYTDMIKLKHAVKLQHRNGANYILDDDVEETIELVLDNTGRPIFSASTKDGPYDRIGRFPYFLSTQSPVIGTVGDVMFGSLAHYVFALEEDIVISRSDQYNFKKGRVSFRLDAYAGGKPKYARVFALLGDPS